MEDKRFSFEGLEVYKAARILVRDIYRLQHKFPKFETYALGDQIRRSSSSLHLTLLKVVAETHSKKSLIS